MMLGYQAFYSETSGYYFFQFFFFNPTDRPTQYQIQNLYVLTVIISLDCNCNKTFVGISK